VIRVLVADDHALFRDGVAALLGSQPDMTLVAEASNGCEAVQQYRAHRPDITLMDLQMPEKNGLDALSDILGESPAARIIVLTTFVGSTRPTMR
jgi:DNA-binding NarL/FixJ family response regulator